MSLYRRVERKRESEGVLLMVDIQWYINLLL